MSGRCINNYTKRPKNRPKWKHIGQVHDWVYPAYLNNEIIKKEKKVILVESIGDMIALWDVGIKNVLVIFGLNVSSGILNFLLKMDPFYIILALNNDSLKNSAGNKATEKNYKTMLKYFDKNQLVIHLPTKNDFGDMTKKEINSWEELLNEKI